jgi:heat shock protein HtpX
MALLLLVSGWTLAGWEGTVWAVIAGVVLLVMNPRVSPKLVLRMYGARQLSPEEVLGLFAVLEELTRRARLPRMPALYYMRSPMMNAFTVGNRAESAIALTEGLLRGLNMRELSGVLAHEVSHVANNDMWVMGMADLVSRITSTFSLFGQMLVLINLPLLMMGEAVLPWLPLLILVASPTLSALLQLALSRAREYDADLDGAELSGDPVGLASALQKLERYQGGLLERIFLPGRRIPDPSLLRTHPRTEERVRRLMSLAQEPRTMPPPMPIP